jgi:glycosyltransferase involved in cell wall biosynthesis
MTIKPTVLHVSPTLVPIRQDAGGVANVVRQLAIYQAKSGKVDVLILCSDTERQKIVSIDLDKSTGVAYSRQVIPQYRYEFAGPFWPVKRYLDSIINEKKGNLVAHIHTCFSSMTDLTARHLASERIPFLFMPHGKTTRVFREQKKYQKLLWLNCTNLRSSIETSGSIGCFSKHEVNETINYLNIRSSVPAFFSPNGFPRVSKSQGTTATISGPDHLNILYLGYLDPRKNIINLLRALRILKQNNTNVTLTVAGPDAYGHEKALRREVRRLAVEDNVIFLGRVDGLEKLKLYQSSSVLVLPSSGEGQPLVLGEALAVGLPIIFSKHCNFSFAAEQGAGIELPSVDPLDIAKSIDNLWKEKSAFLAMKNAAFRVAELHGWSATSEYWMNCYFSMLNN